MNQARECADTVDEAGNMYLSCGTCRKSEGLRERGQMFSILQADNFWIMTESKTTLQRVMVRADRKDRQG